jgi:hypothetical protein
MGRVSGLMGSPTGLTGRIASNGSDPTRAPASAGRRRPRIRTADSGDGDARRRCRQLRLGEGKPTTPATPAAVVGNAPTSSVCKRDGGGVRRRQRDVDDRS